MAKVDRVQRVMDEVYGECSDPTSWVPKKFKGKQGRYLWTDAFGVCNYITLFCETKDPVYIQQADALIKDVHDTLGKDRDLKKRLGNSTDERPLLGGLRIGKEDPEGTPDGDGQYFHYLTKWMYALSRMSLAKKDKKYINWAIDLAKTTYDAFTQNATTGYPRLYWKMNVNLTYPHVDTEGNLDPFDGYVTYRVLQEQAEDPDELVAQIEVFKRMVLTKYVRYRSNDPMDLGEALWITHLYPNEQWSKHIAGVSLKSLEYLVSRGYFYSSEKERLAFREFGTTLGVQVAHGAQLEGTLWNKRVGELNDFWYSKIYMKDHDITPVMYCSSVLPGSFCVEYLYLMKPDLPALS